MKQWPPCEEKKNTNKDKMLLFCIIIVYKENFIKIRQMRICVCVPLAGSFTVNS